jgi:hypothetical protein
MSKTNLSDSQKFTVSHLGILRLFAIWGLLESFIYYVTNGDKKMEIIIHLVVFIGISGYLYYNKYLIDYM